MGCRDSGCKRKLIDFLQTEMAVSNIRFPNSSSIGIKPISMEGSERLIRSAIEYALDNNLTRVTLVHKGTLKNLLKVVSANGVMSWLNVNMLKS